MSPRAVACAALLVLVVLVAGVAGCGRSGPDDLAPATWTRTPIVLPHGPDSPVRMTSDDGRVVVVGTDDGGRLHSTVLTADGAERGTPLSTGLAFAVLGGVARLDGRYVTVGSGGLLDRPGGDDELRFEPVVATSADGLAWEQVDAEDLVGLDGPIDVNDVAAIGDLLVAVGDHRTASDPSNGGFRAAVWTSADAVHWTERTLPSAPGTSHAGSVVVAGDRLLVGGHDRSGGAVWSSEDAGATWSATDLGAGARGDAPDVSDLAAAGGTVVASTASTAAGFLRSTDGGLTWAEPTDPPPSGTEGYSSVSAAGGRWFAWVSRYVEPGPGECYAAPDECGQDRGGLYVSEDGDRWARVDEHGLAGDALESGPAVTAPDGGVALLDGAGLALLPAGASVPTTEEPTPAVADVTEVPASGPEIGVRYAAPLYLHCGSEWLYLGDDEVWRRTDHRGGVPAAWGIGAGQVLYGFATLLTDDRLEYSDAEGTVLAVYERSETRPPGCD